MIWDIVNNTFWGPLVFDQLIILLFITLRHRDRRQTEIQRGTERDREIQRDTERERERDRLTEREERKGEKWTKIERDAE